jgi:hypothetical protein
MGVAIAALSLVLMSCSSADAVGVCSTGHYKTCLTCCATNPTITDRDRCSRGCSDFRDSPLQQQIRDLRANKKHPDRPAN